MNSRDSRDLNRAKGASSDHLPYKPTREAATDTGRPETLGEQRTQPAGSETPEHLGTERREIDDAGTPRHPPHVARHEQDAPVQDEVPSPGAVPVLPANASGADTATADQQDQPMDPESMYDDRPERYETGRPSKRLAEEEKG